MERVNNFTMQRTDVQAAERGRLCLRCGHPVPDLPRGCKGGRCENCGQPYPLGDCSD